MRTMDIEPVERSARHEHRCPICGWRFNVHDDWMLDEMFCGRCETRLLFRDDDKCSRWMAAGVYT